MKLLFCTECQDVVKLGKSGSKRTCQCGKAWGWYHEDGIYATIGGKAVPLGFNNNSLAEAIRNRPDSGMGRKFDAFVIPKECPTITEETMSCWGEDGRCIHCGAGNDAHHSFTCPTDMHPDKREETK